MKRKIVKGNKDNNKSSEDKKKKIVLLVLLILLFIIGIIIFFYVLGSQKKRTITENAERLPLIRSVMYEDPNMADISSVNYREISCDDFSIKANCEKVMNDLGLTDYDLYYTKSIKGNINSFIDDEVVFDYLKDYTDSDEEVLVLHDKTDNSVEIVNYKETIRPVNPDRTDDPTNTEKPIEKTPAVITCLDPVYNGKVQNIAECSGGTLSDNAKQKDVGKQIITCIGDEEHTEASAICSVQKYAKPIALTVVKKEVGYIGNIVEADIEASLDDIEIQTKYYSDRTCYAEVDPVNVGTYYVVASVKATENYNETTLECTEAVTITKVDDEIYATSKYEIFNEQPVEANEASCASKTELTYAYFNGQTCEGDPLPGPPTEIGNYSVQIKSQGNDNYNPGVKCIKHTIGFESTATTGECNDLVENGKNQKLASGARYASYFNNIAKNPGEYEVIVRADGTHTFEDGEKVKVLSCSIKKNENVAVAGECNKLTYNGKSQVLVSGGSNVTYSNNNGRNAGGFVVTAKAEPGYLFDNGKNKKTIKCTIDKKKITVTAGSKSKAYDGAELTDNTCTSDDLVLDDVLTCVMSPDSRITDVGTTTNDIERVDITSIFFKVTGNYDITMVSGELKVDPAEDTIYLYASTITYDGNPHDIDIKSASGRPVEVTYFADDTCQTPLEILPTDAGQYYVSASTEENESYFASKLECQLALTINQKEDVLELEPISTSYTGEPISADVATCESRTAISYEYFNSTDCTGEPLPEGAPTEVGEYSVLATSLGNNNYISGNRCVTHTITEGRPVITLTPVTATYNGTPILHNDATATDAFGNPVNLEFTYKYYSNDTCKYEESDNAPIDSGIYYVRATSAPTENLVSGKSECVPHTILKRPVIVTAASVAKEYDGVPLTDDNCTADNLISGDIVSCRMTDESIITDAGITGNVLSIVNIMSGNKFNNYNYDITMVNGTLQIYANGGATLGECNTLFYNGFPQTLAAGGDYVRYSNNEQTNAGEYTVTVTAFNNYKFEDEETEKTMVCSIAKKDDEIKSNPVIRTYTGNRIYANIATNESGTLNTYTYYSSPTCDGDILTNAPKNAGFYSVLITSAGDSNFNPGELCVPHTILKGTPIITLEPREVMYTGAPIPANPAEGQEPNGNYINLDYTYKYYFDSECTQGETTRAPTKTGDYYVKAVSEETDNLLSGESACVTHKINGRILTVSVTAEDKEYDGTIDATCNLSIEGVVNGDDVEAVAAVHEFEDKNAGEDKYVYCGGLHLIGDDADGYVLDAESLDTTATINPRPITVTAGTKIKAYDGKPLTDSSCVSYDIVAGDMLTCMMTPESTITNVGTVDNVINTVLINGDPLIAPKNYLITKVNGLLTVEFNRGATTGTCDDLEYNAEPQVLAKGGEYVTYQDNVETNAGSYIVTVKTNRNYLFEDDSTTKQLTCMIKRKHATITAASKIVVFTGLPLIDNSCSSEDLAGNDEVFCRMDAASTITDVGSVENSISTATIKNGEEDRTSNYTMNFVTGRLTVTPDMDRLTLTPIRVPYDKMPKRAMIQTTSQTEVTIKYYSDMGCTMELSEEPVDAGIYYITATSLGNSNYSPGYLSCSKAITILKKRDVLQTTEVRAEYTGNKVEANTAYSESGTNMTYTYYDTVNCVGTPRTDAPIDVGFYSSKATSAGNNNYESNSICATLTISQGTPLISLVPREEYYTGEPIYANPAIFKKPNGEDATEQLTYLYYTDELCTQGETASAPINAGQYYVQVTSEESTNLASVTSECVPHTIFPEECGVGYENNASGACTLIEYEIEYQMNGATNSPLNPTKYTIETNTFTLINPQLDGYRFAGWTGSNGTTPSTSISVEKGTTGNLTYSANWYPKAVITCTGATYSGEEQAIATCTGGTISDNAYQVEVGQETITCEADEFHSEADPVVCSLDKRPVSLMCYNDTTTHAADTIMNLVAESPSNTQNIITLDAPIDGSNCTNTLAYDGTVDNNLRYVGANPCNYVTFNGETAGWRIVGVFDGKVKIVRNNYIASLPWHTSSSNNWNNSSLKTLLNSGDYYNRRNSYATIGLTDQSKELIADATWKLGGTQSYSSYNVRNYYSQERSTYVYGSNPREWVGKVGLLYPSDYGFATSGGNNNYRLNTCLSYSLYSWNSYSNCVNNDYLNHGYSSFFITHYGYDSYNVMRLNSSGWVGTNGSTGYNYIYPAVYLREDAIINGDGTNNNPYFFGQVIYNGTPQKIASCPDGTMTNAVFTNAGTYEITCTGDINHEPVTKNCRLLPQPCSDGYENNEVGGCELITYRITIDLDGGQTVVDIPTQFNVNSETIILPFPTKEGYIFAGWIGSNGETPQKIVEIPKGSVGDRNYKAVFKLPTDDVLVSVRYDINGGVGKTPEMQEINYNHSLVLKEDAESKEIVRSPNIDYSGNVTGVYNNNINMTTPISFDKVGDIRVQLWYDLQGTSYDWITIYKGIGASPNDSDDYTISTATGNVSGRIAGVRSVRNTAFYQTWNYRQYTINDSTIKFHFRTSSSTQYYGFYAIVSLNSFYKDGYDFIGWNTKPDGTGDHYEPGEPINPTDNIVLYAEYLNYPIEYDLDGGTGNLPATYKPSVGYTLDNPTKVDYEFVGWTGSNGTETQKDLIVLPGTEGEASYTAHWTRKYYLTYNLDGGSHSNRSYYTELTPTFNLSTPSKSGYDFVGWTGSNGDVVQRTVTIPVGSTGDKQYTAHWTIRYPITYTTYGGSHSNPSAYSVISSTITIGSASKTGYRFLGWTGSNGDEPQLNPTIPSGSTGERHYEAHYEPIEYTISLDLVNGTIENAPETYTIESETFTLPSPTKEGYVFLGWEDYLGDVYTTITIPQGSTGNKTYKARYQNLTPYTITYHLNGAQGVVPSPQTNEFDDVIIIDDFVKRRIVHTSNITDSGIATTTYTNNMDETRTATFDEVKDYTIDVWYDTESTTWDWVAVYKGANSIPNTNNDSSISTATGNISGKIGGRNSNRTVLYSTWNHTRFVSNDKVFKFHFRTDGSGVYYGYYAEITYSDPPVMPGYKFGGWNTEPDGTGMHLDGRQEYIPTSDLTLYAEWLSTSRIIYELDGGTNNSQNPEIFALNDEITLGNPTKEGYDFMGWTGPNVETPTKNVTVKTDVEEDVTYTAHWTPFYPIYYDLGGGTNNSSNKRQYSIITPTFTIYNPSREGYDFVGWTGSNGNTPQQSIQITLGSTGTRSYTAHWERQYTISYDVQNGSHNNPTKYSYISSDITLRAPTRTGYTFMGWIGSNGEEPEMTVTIPHNSRGDRSYIALWEPIVYTIEYDLVGGTIDGVNEVEFTIESDTFEIINPTKEGYKFRGWTGSCGNIPVNVRIEKGSYGNRKYKAEFENLTPVTITFDLNGGEGITPEPISNIYSDQISPLKYVNDIIVHSHNVSDDGYASSVYNNGIDKTDTIEFPDEIDATINIWYDTENASCDWISIYNGRTSSVSSNNDATISESTGNFTGKLSGRRSGATKNYNTWLHQTYEVNTDTLKFHFRTDGSVQYNGYYATVSYDVKPTKEGYTFIGWNTEADGSGTHYEDGEVITPTEDMHLYAEWGYIISYELNGGTIENAPKGFNVNSQTIVLPEPTRTGYEFVGWTGSNGDEPQLNVTIPTGSEGDRTYIANFANPCDGNLYCELRLRYYDHNYVAKYEGMVTDEVNNTVQASNVYYFYGPRNDSEAINNNVIFADTCWYILRTTETEGVKLLYNGPPDADGHCGKGRQNHAGISGSRTTIYIYYNNNYVYGSDFEFDGTNFKVSGDIITSKWNSTTAESLRGMYTCVNSNSNATCTTLYQIDSFSSSSYAYAYPINSIPNYSVGSSTYNSNSSYMSDVGFMYNNGYGGSSSKSSSTSVISNSYIGSYNYYYGEGVEYVNGKYHLTGTIGLKGDFPDGDISGKYTFYSSNRDYTSSGIYKVIRASSTTSVYGVYLQNGETTDSETQKIYFGSELTCDTSNNCYLEGNVISISKYNWINSYENVPIGYYTCRNSSTSCTNPSQVTSRGSTSYSYVYVGYYKFGENFSYDESTNTYRLTGDSENINDWYNRYQNVSNYRYTCFNTTGTCTGNIYFVTYASNTTLNYFSLKNGRRLDEALYEMGFDVDGFDIVDYEEKYGEYTLNSKSSNAKKILDSYYNRELSQFTDMLEDNVYCNRREVANFGSYDPYRYDFVNSSLLFKDNSANMDLSCERLIDQFSTSNEEAHLTNPIGLITGPEIYLSNNINGLANNTSIYNSSFTYTGNYSWTMTPGNYSGNSYVRTTSPTYYTGNSLAIRPVISLKPETKFNEGDGSFDNPYVIDVSEGANIPGDDNSGDDSP